MCRAVPPPSVCPASLLSHLCCTAHIVLPFVILPLLYCSFCTAISPQSAVCPPTLRLLFRAQIYTIQDTSAHKLLASVEVDQCVTGQEGCCFISARLGPNVNAALVVTVLTVLAAAVDGTIGVELHEKWQNQIPLDTIEIYVKTGVRGRQWQQQCRWQRTWW